MPQATEPRRRESADSPTARIQPTASAQSAPAGARRWLFGILIAAAALRLIFSFHKGLVLDEFHSIFHADAPDAATFFARLVQDNHPPLTFLTIGAAQRLLGSSEFVLRLPALIFGLLEILLVWRLARRLPGRWAPAIAALLVAASSLHLEIGTQARMYALHALALTGALEALLSFLEAPAGSSNREAGLLLVIWTAVGLHNHYYYLHYLGALVLALVLACALAPHARAQARRVLPWFALALILCIPWYLLGFWRQLSHGLPPGMTSASPARIGEALIHLLFLNLRALGDGPRLGFIACGLIAVLVLAPAGALRLWRTQLQTRGVALPLLLLGLAFGAPIWAGLIAALSERTGFNWTYLAPSIAPLCLLIAAAAAPGRGQRWLRPLVGLVCAAALLLSSAIAFTTGTEDYRGAIASVLERVGPHDAVVTVEWQPPVFEQGLAWRYYEPRLAPPGAPPRERLELHAGFGLREPQRLSEFERVWVLRRSLPMDADFWRPLRQRFGEPLSENWGYGLSLHCFGPAPP